MKFNFSYFIKISLMLVLFLQVGTMCGQTKIDYTFGSSTNFANGTMNIPASRNNKNVDFNCLLLDSAYPWLDAGHFAQVNFTNSASKVVVEFLGVHEDDIMRLEVNGALYPITADMLSCGFVTCTSFPQCNTPSFTNGTVTNAGPNASRLTIAPTTPITSFRITCTVGASGFGLSNFTYTLCTTGVTAPSLSATTISNVCPVTTVNLSSLVTSATPSGNTLKWYTDAARTTELTSPSAVTTAGTYYAFYYNTNSNCFSAATAAVTANIAVCCTTQIPDLTN